MNSINSHASPCKKIVKNHSNARWYETESILTVTLQKCVKTVKNLVVENDLTFQEFQLSRIVTGSVSDVDLKWIGS